MNKMAELPRQVYAGLLFIVIGAFFLWQSSYYPLGSANSMGPAYFPVGLSLILIGFGAAACVQALVARTGPRVEHLKLASLFFMLASVLAFGFLIETLGLAAAIAALVALSCYDRLRTKPLEVLAIFIVVCSIVVGVFVFGLGLQFKVF